MENIKTSSKHFYDELLPNGSESVTEEFLQQVFDKIFDHIKVSSDRSQKMVNFINPEVLMEKMDLSMPKEPMSLDKVVADCEIAMRQSVKTGNPRFWNQLYQGCDIVSLAGEWVTSACNTNIFTYEVAPVFTLVEEVVLKKMMSMIGWNPEEGDGLFNPGGSISNLYAVQVARHHRFPNLKKEGLFGMPKLIIYTSGQCHYSTNRAASISGFGLDQIKSIPCDERGKIIPAELEKEVKKSLAANEIPLLVCLTAGTTVLGAFDPINPVADLCQKYKLWLHVDAAWGGGCIASRKHKHLVDGIERADSVTWNPHKLLGALLQCSAFLVKHKNVLSSCNAMQASYLFQKDKHYDMSYDKGDKTIQCGRHVDVFKFWLMWRAKGDSGMEKRVDHLMDMAKLLRDECVKRDGFEMVLDNPEYTNVCFWFIPPSMRNMDRNSDDFKKKLNGVAPKIKERMMRDGSMMIGYQPLGNIPNFFRMVVGNGGSTAEDIIFIVDEIERLGQDL